MDNKVIVPKQVADAIAHYVTLADSKTEALQDILRLGYEAERSEIILRHFEHDYDELMEALICGYEIEKTPEEKIRNSFNANRSKYRELGDEGDYYYGVTHGIKLTLEKLGIKIEGVNN